MATSASEVRSEPMGASKIQVFDVELSGTVTSGTFSTGLDYIYWAGISSSTATSKPTIGKNFSTTSVVTNGDVFIEDAATDDTGISVIVYGR